MRRGFTLVELAIVLVIVGLLIGGILVAQSMTSTAKTLQLIKTSEQYLTAARNFKTSYGYWPGDYPKSTFGCAGNGDGTLNWTQSGGVACIFSGFYNFEGTNFFVQMSMVNMIPDKLTYLTSGAIEAMGPLPGTNAPRGPDKNSYFRVQNFYLDNHGDTNVVEMTSDVTAAASAGVSSSYMMYGLQCSIVAGASHDRYMCPVLTATGASAIDIKIDDGLPGTGNFIAGGTGGYCGKATPLTTDHHKQSYPGVPYYPDNKNLVCIVGWRVQD